MTDQTAGAATPPPSRPPPGLSVGPLAWIKHNLFNSVLSSIGTLVVGAVIVWLVWTVFDWIVLNGIWEAGPEGEESATCRQQYGYCFPFLQDMWGTILFGTYPGSERWRPAMAVLLIILMLVMSALRVNWRPHLLLAWYVAAVLAGILMFGGVLSLATIFWIVMLGAPLVRRVMPELGSGVGQEIPGNPVTDRLGLFWTVWLALAALFVAVDLLAPAVTGAGFDTGLRYVPNTQWGGLPLTLGLSLIGCGVAFPLGILLALGRRSNMPAIRVICVVYIEFIRGVPLITILFMASVLFPLFLPEGVTIDKLLRAQVGLILFAAAYLAEVVRGGLQAIPKGQYEAADSLGLTYWQKTRLIILPQALRISIPPLVNTFIGFFKDTSLVIIIGLFDLLNGGRIALTEPIWRGFYPESYTFVALIYFAFCFSLSKYSQWLEGQMNTGHSR
ncbi:MAG: amino acid ABC transporter permease [Azospirillaceae bacterium]